MARPRKSHTTREQLLEQGLKIFLSRGYNGTGIKAVLDEVSVPKGSFYNYFDSKEDFVLQIIRHYNSESEKFAEEAFGSSDDPLESLKGFFRKQISCNEESKCAEGCLLGNLGSEISGQSELCREEISKAWRVVESRFAEKLTLAQEHGSVRSDIRAEVLAAQLLMAWQGALIRMKVDASVEPLEDFCKTMLGDFLSTK